MHACAHACIMMHYNVGCGYCCSYANMHAPTCPQGHAKEKLDWPCSWHLATHHHAPAAVSNSSYSYPSLPSSTSSTGWPPLPWHWSSAPPACCLCQSINAACWNSSNLPPQPAQVVLQLLLASACHLHVLSHQLPKLRLLQAPSPPPPLLPELLVPLLS
jgi:hypothetical protein